MLIDNTIGEFLDATASKSPAPGGGSVSALAGALGAALASMVGELSINKEEDINAANKIRGMLRICKDLINSLKQSIDDDTEAFNKVMAAYKLPKSSEEETQKRSCEIQEALMDASETPYETALLCIDVMNIAYDMLKYGNRNAASDASVSGFLGYAALNGALLNVRINLKTIKDKSFAESMKLKVEELSSESEALLLKIRSLSLEIIG